MSRRKVNQPAQVDEADIHSQLARRIDTLRQDLGALTQLAGRLRGCPASPDVDQAMHELDVASRAVALAEQRLSERFQRVLCRTDTPYGNEGGIRQISVSMFGIASTVAKPEGK